MGKCLRGTSNCIRFAFFDYVLESWRGEISVESFKHSTHEKFVYKSLNTKTEIHAIRIDRSEGSLTFFPALTFVSNREGCGGGGLKWICKLPVKNLRSFHTWNEMIVSSSETFKDPLMAKWMDKICLRFTKHVLVLLLSEETLWKQSLETFYRVG